VYLDVGSTLAPLSLHRVEELLSIWIWRIDLLSLVRHKVDRARLRMVDDCARSRGDSFFDLDD
jgi:hypothetical protein